MKGYVFDIKKFAVHDGPGIRTTLFLKGCPLKCIWCHNPEGINVQPELWFFQNRCIGCGLCIGSCPVQALSWDDAGKKGKHILIDQTLCDSCGLCVEACPSGALQFDGREMDHIKAVETLMEDRSFYAESGGGITVSGGDPVYQHEFAIEVLKACQSEGIHTAMESSLFCSSAVLQSFVPCTDLFICDLKILDDKKHREYTGGSVRPVLDNLRLLARSGKDILVRTPLIPGMTATDENLKEIGEFLLSLEGSVSYELLNYNPLALNKYEIRKEDNPDLLNLKPFDPEQMDRWNRMMAGMGLKIVTE